LAKGKYHDIVDSVRDFKLYNDVFYVDMKHWKSFQSRVKLNWERIRFEAANRVKIPKERGVYAFTLLLDSADLPIHGYILYMGITGDKSKANLYLRYGQYLADSRRMNKRPLVCAMLEKWKGDLFFNFVPIPDKRVSLSKLERSFLSAVVPPVNEADIDAKVSAKRKAAW
jgi:hypothetical protein